MPPFVRSGDAYLPSLGVAAALAAGGFRPDEVVLEGQRFVVRDRGCRWSPARVLDAVGGTELPRAVDDADQLPGAGAGERHPAVQVLSRRGTCSFREDQMLAGQKPLVDPAVFKDKIVFVGLTASGLVDVFQTPFAAAPCPGSSCTPAWPTASCRTGSSRRRPGAAAAARDAVGAAGASGCWPALLPFAAAGRAPRLADGRLDAGLRSSAFRGGLWLNLVAAAAGDGARAVCRHRLPVLRRGPREAEGQEAVRPICVEGRLRAADGAPRAGGARRQAPRDDGSVLGHPRLHHGHRDGATPRSWSRS